MADSCRVNVAKEGIDSYIMLEIITFIDEVIIYGVLLLTLLPGAPSLAPACKPDSENPVGRRGGHATKRQIQRIQCMT